MKRIIVASTNPVKLAAARDGFRVLFPDEEIVTDGVSVPSGVSDQPMTDTETLQGALNRANSACEVVSNADYWVAFEGGIEREDEHEMQAFAWAVVLSNDLVGKAKSGTFYLPCTIVNLINGGMELGEADDTVFRLHNSKQNGGAVGRLTHGVISRTELYKHAVILALIPFRNTELYQQCQAEQHL